VHALQHGENYLDFLNGPDRVENRNQTRIKKLELLSPPKLPPNSAKCQISKFQNFHNFSNFYQPKGCFLSDRQKKKSRILRIKKYEKKKKPIAVFKKKERERPRQPTPPTPKRSEKSIFIFAIFFCFFV
jgi:hypothetical protein